MKTNIQHERPSFTFVYPAFLMVFVPYKGSAWGEITMTYPRKRLSLLRLNLASRIRFDRLMRVEITGYQAYFQGMAIREWGADGEGYHRYVMLEELNDEN